eukprot:gene1231-11321_t
MSEKITPRQSFKTNSKPIPLKKIKGIKYGSNNSSPLKNCLPTVIERKISLPTKIEVSKNKNEIEEYKSSPVLRRRFLELKEKKEVEEEKLKEENSKTSPTTTTKLNYKKGDLIGSGSNAKVYLSFNFDNGSFFAVKEINFTKCSINQMEKKFNLIQREITLMKNFNHPNIVSYLGCEKEETCLNIFLEYIPGGSIFSLIQKFGRLDEKLIKKFTQQILLGLQYLHKNKIVHRDIKGANILLTIDGNVKLADFGGSRELNDLLNSKDGLSTLTGTPNYMAPEVIMETGHGRAADIWSIGCTILEMFTGKAPFSEYSTPASVMFHVASSNSLPDFPNYLSENAKNFLSKCFVRNPKLRPSANELLNDIWFQEFTVCEPKLILSTPILGSSKQFQSKFESNEDLEMI